MAKQVLDIQVSDIEKELDRQWSLQKKDRDTKATLFTLLIYAQDKKRLDYLQDLINTILDKFPCRIILIQGDASSKSSYFHVNVSNVASGQNQDIRCDQIVIEASQDQLFRVPYIITAHIVPDLPIYLLWGQNPFEEKNIFPQVQKYARRVIFASECADDLQLFCQEMKHNLDVLKMDVMDINWALVSNWRDIISELFATPEKLEQLKACKSIIIKYNNHTAKKEDFHPETRPLFLQGWLASALEWKFQSIERFDQDVIISYFKEHPIIIALSPESKRDLPYGSINSIEMTTLHGDSYFIERRENLHQVIVHCSSQQTCELPYALPLPNVHKGLAFLREIFFGALGCHYRETLEMISQLNLNIFKAKK